MKKRLLALVLAALMILSSACGSSGATTAADTPADTQPAATTPAPTTPAPTTPDPTTPPETEPAVDPKAVDTSAEEFAPDFNLYDAEGNVVRINRTAIGDTGVVTAARVEASRAGLEIIEMGGNAVDAACAVSFALGVCEPAASGMGGGSLMLIRAENGDTVFLDGREIAPMAATPDLWPVGEDGKVIDSVKTQSGKANCVPTNVATLWKAYNTYGSGNVTWAEIIAPAIRLAENGFEMSQNLKGDTESSIAKLTKFNNGEGGKVFLKDGFPYEVGEIFKNPDLANTLRIVAEKGAAGFYEGEVAKAIVDANNESGGVMTLDDLLLAEKTQPVVREPMKGTYRGYTVISAAPASSGGTHIIEMLNILENFELNQYAQNSSEYINIVAETLYMAFCDRAAFMGDPAYTEGGLPLMGLTNKEYAKARAAEIVPGTAQKYEAGDPWSYDSTAYTSPKPSEVAGAASSLPGAIISVNTDDVYESTETTHFSVADKYGNMVSCTQTINGYYGSGVIPTGLGFPLNNQCSDFGIGWGLPNSVEGGKKPLSSMSPTIVLDPNGDPFLVLGTPGGTRIFPTVMQCILGAIDYGLTVQEMVNVPRFWYSNGGTLQYEDRIAPAEIAKLEAMGYKTQSFGSGWSRSPGTVNAIMYGGDGKLYGMGDSRKDSKALGY